MVLVQVAGGCFWLLCVHLDTLLVAVLFLVSCKPITEQQ
jgi:hypothetical protein